MEIHMGGETIKKIEPTEKSEGGYRVSVSFGMFSSIDQCKRFLAQLEDLALTESGQTKLATA